MEIREFDASTLQTLTESQGGPHLTAYLRVPTQADRAEQVRIELKNTLQKAEAELEAKWMTAADAKKFLTPLAEACAQLVEEASPGTLAIFLADDIYHVYGLRKDVGQAFQIHREFQLRPLISAVQDFSPAYLLAISENQVQLYEASPHRLHQVEVPNMPVNFEEELNVVSADRGQQVRTVGTFGNRPSIYHGQGGEADAHADELRQYLHNIDQAVTRYLADSQTPLYLATVEATAATYQELTQYAHVQSEILCGNPDHVSPSTLHTMLLEYVSNSQSRSRETFCAQLRESLHSPTASVEPSVIVPSAFQGRLNRLFISDGLRIYGHYDEQLCKAVITEAASPDEAMPYGDDLVEAIIHQTILANGEVCVVADGSLPEQSLIGAQLRY